MTAVVVDFIPHQEQRYDTCGDWWFDNTGTLQIRVSILPDERMMQAIALHEQVEALLCKASGIEEVAVMEFDLAFEKYREPGNTDEPGDHPTAPYHFQHVIATNFERTFLAAAGISWAQHEAAVNNLPSWGKGEE
jgi:hypothetical protein